MDIQVLYLGIGLLSLVVINIVLGFVSSIFQQKFDKIKLFQGVVKGIIVTSCFLGVIYVGKLTPEIIVINVNGIDVDLATATHMLMLSGYLFYSKQVLVKLSSFVRGEYKIDENVGTIDQKSLINSPVINLKSESGTITQTDNSEGK